MTMLYRGFYYSAKSAADGLLCLQGRVFAIRKAGAFIVLTVVIFLLGFSKNGGMQMQKKSLSSRAFWLILISGMVTGMGNGSVFGAAMMCALGRSPFSSWGGDGATAYTPSTFTGFMDMAMIVFGIAFCIIMVIGLNRHDKLEKESDRLRQTSILKF
ncbi:MAG: hypothetical protein WA435_10215 [Gallionellaceae bacterium]